MCRKYFFFGSLNWFFTFDEIWDCFFFSQKWFFSKFEGRYWNNWFFLHLVFVLQYSDEIFICFWSYKRSPSKKDSTRWSAVIFSDPGCLFSIFESPCRFFCTNTLFSSETDGVERVGYFFGGSLSPIFLFDEPSNLSPLMQPLSAETDMRAWKVCPLLYSTGWLVSSKTDESPPSGGAGGTTMCDEIDNEKTR